MGVLSARILDPFEGLKNLGKVDGRISCSFFEFKKAWI